MRIYKGPTTTYIPSEDWAAWVNGGETKFTHSEVKKWLDRPGNRAAVKELNERGIELHVSIRDLIGGKL